MRRKILALLIAAGMMVLDIAGCGKTGENQNAGNQEQTEGKAEDTEAKEFGTQDSGQSAPSQENADVQGSHSVESTAPENTGHRWFI